MISIDLNVVVAISSILAIAAGAILFMVKLWNKVENSLIKHTIALDGLIEEIGSLKRYGPRITAVEKDVALINQRCDMVQKTKKEGN